MSGSASRSRTSSDPAAGSGAGYRRFVVVISGPSGVGKTSFVDGLLRAPLDLVYSVSATTRPRRPHEEEGRDYWFLTREEFRRRVAEGAFVEWAEVHGELYGTLRSEVDARLASGRNVLLDIDVQGGRAVRKVYPEAVLIFVLPPSMEALESRLRGRGTDSEERIRVRLENARREIGLMPEYDYAVVNDDLEVAKKQVHAIIASEMLRTARRTAPGTTPQGGPC